jgi:hypothetical protein
MVIVRVPIDIDFCKHLVTKCEQFIKAYLIVELVTRRWPLHLQKTKKMKIFDMYVKQKNVRFAQKPSIELFNIKTAHTHIVILSIHHN